MKLCGSCFHMDEQPLDSGVHYCRARSMWVWPDSREYDGRKPECEKHVERASLQGALAGLARALARNTLAVKISSGELDGTITPNGFVYDPTIPEPPRKRRKKT
jgi:hypothetical protein